MTVGLDNKNKIAAVWLNAVCGLSSLRLRALERLSSFAEIVDKFEEMQDELVAEIGSEAYGKITHIDKVRVKKMSEYFLDNGISVVLSRDPEYPERFLRLSDYPPVLYCKGDLSLLKTRAAAIVGSREPSKNGKKVAASFATAFVEKGLTVVSGMARGIDSEAHNAALDANGKTVAVLGTGVDVVYPADNAELYAKLVKEGLIISEYPVCTQAAQFRFPERNRLISALTEAVFVAEASEKSGSLITARHALEQGIKVYAVPAEISNPRGAGNNELLKKNRAVFVTSPKDILIDLALEQEVDETERPPVPDIELSDVEKVIVERLSYTETHFDDLLTLTALGIGELTATLTKLELLGQIVQLDNNYFGV